MAQSCELMGITTWSSEGLIWESKQVTEVNLVMELENYGQLHANTCNFTCMLLFNKSTHITI